MWDNYLGALVGMMAFAKGAETGANHYGTAFAPEACEAIQRFLGADGGA